MGLKINALVLGAGNFGWHYARILSHLNRKRISHIPKIDKLIVTRTRLRSARDVAEAILHDPKCSVNRVIAEEAYNTQGLVAILEQYRPKFIGIAARDKQLGDTIHAAYAIHALAYGAVLCEKPFSNATGDGSSLAFFSAMHRHDKQGRFGLELPMAVALRDIMKNRELRGLFIKAQAIEFFWQAGSSMKNVMDDLALHPWSMIPNGYRMVSIEAQNLGKEAEIMIQLLNEHTARGVTCRISLKTGGSFRGLMIDNYSIGIKSSGTRLELVRLKSPLKDAVKGKEDVFGKCLLKVDNPLEQHIIAALQNKPIVGLTKAYDSQTFLEVLHGYKTPYQP